MRFSRSAVVAMTFLLLVVASAGANQQKGVEQEKVDAAIDKGLRFLMAAGAASVDHVDYDNKKIEMRNDELVLLTWIHAGVEEQDERFATLLKEIMDRPLKRTYQVALQAMALMELDRAKYQWRIAQCGQFLVDNQCANGQWRYGEPFDEKDIPTGMQRPPKDIDTGDKPSDQPPRDAKHEARKLTDVKEKLKIKRRKPGPENGDNSNAQYAALGLRACILSGVEIPKETLQLAEQWWQKDQHPDGGWGYSCKGQRAPEESYGSMTVGAVGSLVIYKHFLKSDYKKDAAVVKGMNWLAKNFAVDKNPKFHEAAEFHYYYLYAVERLGLMYGTDKIGSHDWYAKGAEFLLNAQMPDGSWDNHYPESTCFAILFLRRATRPIYTK